MIDGQSQPRSVKLLPDGWRHASLGDLADLNPTLGDPEPDDEDEVSFIPMKAVEEESGRLDPSRTRPWKEVKRGYTRFKEGDILFAKITPCMENGKFAIASGLCGGRGAGSTEFHVLRPKSDLDSRYLLYFLLSSDVRRAATLTFKGTAGQLRVPESFLNALDFPVAPPVVQRAIVNEIETQLTRLKTASEFLRRASANLKRYRAAVLKAAFAGELVPTEAELAKGAGRPFESGKELVNHIRLDVSKMRLKKRSIRGEEPRNASPRQLPAGWGSATIEEVADEVVDCPHSTPKYGVGDCFAVDTTCIEPCRVVLDRLRRVTRETFTDRTRRLVPKGGDLIFAREGTVGTVTALPFGMEICLGQRVMLIRPHRLLSNSYVAFVLMSEDVRKQYRSRLLGSTVQHLNVRDVVKLTIPIAPAAEQSRIVQELDRQSGIIDAIERTLEASVKRSRMLRGAILASAFSGKLAVPGVAAEGGLG